MLAEPAEPAIFYAASNRGLFRLAGGRTWERLPLAWPAERLRRQHAQAQAPVAVEP